MKRMVTSLLITVLLMTAALPACAVSDQDLPELLFETVKWSVDFPKDAQIVKATEFLCKVGDFQLHLLLAEVTQHEETNNMYGTSSRILLIDLDTGSIINYKNIVWPEEFSIATREDALFVIFAGYDSYMLGYSPFIFAEHEITFPLAQEVIDDINARLAEHFLLPADAQ